MISKELFTGMRKDEYTILDIDYDSEDSKIGYLLSNNQWYFINIHELAHKCKQWAAKKGHDIWSSAYGCECYIDGRNFVNNENIRFLEGSEPEAIFQACEWILKQKENNE